VTQGQPLSFKHLGNLKGTDKEAKAKDLIRLFGGAPDSNNDDILVKEIGPSRLSFWDCSLDQVWAQEMNDKNLLLTETKMENMIDRIRGVAEHPRNTERVPATARFDFNLTIRVHDGEDLLDTVLQGMKLLELTGLGGSGSRGYGKIKFTGLMLGDNSVQNRLETLNP
jgi:CRISPR-associated protein Csm3